MKTLREILINIPTTKLRILVSIILTVWTAYAVLVRNWDPNWEWLAFLALNTGLDISQYAVRKNYIAQVDEPEPNEDKG